MVAVVQFAALRWFSRPLILVALFLLILTPWSILAHGLGRRKHYSSQVRHQSVQLGRIVFRWGDKKWQDFLTDMPFPMIDGQ